MFVQETYGRAQHRVGQSELVESHEGAPQHAVRTRIAYRFRKWIDHTERNAARRQVVRQGEPAGTRADDQNVAFQPAILILSDQAVFGRRALVLGIQRNPERARRA
jgi:hypothetical protein